MKMERALSECDQHTMLVDVSCRNGITAKIVQDGVNEIIEDFNAYTRLVRQYGKAAEARCVETRVGVWFCSAGSAGSASVCRRLSESAALVMDACRLSLWQHCKELLGALSPAYVLG